MAMCLFECFQHSWRHLLDTFHARFEMLTCMHMQYDVVWIAGLHTLRGSVADRSVPPCQATTGSLSCSYMKNMSDILESISSNLPEAAAPVASELREQIVRAKDKVEKYGARGQANALWHARAEAVRSQHFGHHASPPCITAMLTSRNKMPACEEGKHPVICANHRQEP